MSRRILCAGVSLVWLALGACRGGPVADRDAFTASAAARRFDIEGTVVSLDKPARQMTIAHGEVKGFMDAMTMPFTVKETWAFDAAAAGDRVQGTLVVDGGRAWVESVKLTRADPSTAVSTTKATWAPADPGTPVPDAAFTDQDGRPLRLATWRGRPYLITFSYTQCPLEEFCPLMMQRFAALEKATASDPTLAGVRLLTVTLDPEHDTPARLREYGAKYATGKGNADPFSRWSLATGSTAEVKKLAAFFGLDYYTEASGQVIHSLRTAIVDREGRVAHVFESNTWQVEAVLEALRAAAVPAS